MQFYSTPNNRFQSISAGNDHLLALTSKGRVFSLPLSLNANSHGQLGRRKVVLASPTASVAVHEDLTPVGESDPFSQSTPFKRLAKGDEGQLVYVPIRPEGAATPISQTTTNSADPKPVLDEASIRFSTALAEIPALSGVTVSQAAAGGRSSFVRVEGQVLAWGANEHG